MAHSRDTTVSCALMSDLESISFFTTMWGEIYMKWLESASIYQLNTPLR